MVAQTSLPEFLRLRQEDGESRANLDCIARQCIKK